jgi:protein-arginine kinase activator protein McsA
MINTQIETGKEAVIVELKNLGYTEKEMDNFQKTTKCPRCGCDFSSLPYSGRWLAHLSNCNGKHSKTIQTTLV